MLEQGGERQSVRETAGGVCEPVCLLERCHSSSCCSATPNALRGHRRSRRQRTGRGAHDGQTPPHSSTRAPAIFFSRSPLEPLQWGCLPPSLRHPHVSDAPGAHDDLNWTSFSSGCPAGLG